MAGPAGGAGDQVRARKLDIRMRGGEVFEMQEVVHDGTVIFSELFSEQERRLLKKELKEQTLLFSIRDNFEVVVRTVWQEAAKDRLFKLRQGHTAVLLHDVGGACANGWCWGKLVRPLFNRGFSVVMLEWPGFGNSRYNCGSRPGDRQQQGWRRIDGDIVAHVLSELGVGKFHVVAHGTACEAAVRIIQDMPNRVEKSHIFHNPIIDINRFFPRIKKLGDSSVSLEDWTEWAKEQWAGDLATLLREAGMSIFSTFEQDALKVKACADTKEAILRMKALSIFLNASLIVEDVMKTDITEVQMGVHCPIRFLFPSKQMRKSLPRFLQNPSRVHGLDSADPNDDKDDWYCDLKSCWANSSVSRIGTRPNTRDTNLSFASSGAYSVGSCRMETAHEEGSRPASGQAASSSGPRPASRQNGHSSQSDEGSRPGSKQRAASSLGARPLGSNELMSATELAVLPEGVAVGELLRSAHSPTEEGRKGRRNVQRGASEGSLVDNASRRPPEADIAGARRRAAGELYSDPRLLRQSLVSKVPRDLLPHDPCKLRRPITREQDMKDIEYNQLEDGLDASVLHYIGEAKRLKQFGGSEAMQRLMSRRSDGKRDPELTKERWKSMTKALKETETNYRASRPRSGIFGMTM